MFCPTVVRQRLIVDRGLYGTYTDHVSHTSRSTCSGLLSTILTLQSVNGDVTQDLCVAARGRAETQLRRVSGTHTADDNVVTVQENCVSRAILTPDASSVFLSAHGS